jgi:hypothetical protein
VNSVVGEGPGLTGREASIALVLALLAALSILWPVVFEGKVPVPADAVRSVEPWLSEAAGQPRTGPPWNPLITDSLWQVVPEGVAAHRLWSGGLPLWDPNPACGLPGFAQGRMYSNPGFNLIARFTGPVRAIGWTALIQLTVALWGAYLLARQIGAIPAAAGVAAVAFGLNLYLVVWLPHTPFFGAMVWLPLVFFGYERAVATGTGKWVALGAVVFAIQILEGHISTPFFGAVTLGIWSVVRAVARFRAAKAAASPLGPIAIAAGVLVLGAMLAAPQLLASAELYLQSPRGEAIGADSTVELEQGLRIVAPWFWGHHFHGGTYVGPFNVAELGLYFGVLPLALIAVAPLASRRLEGVFFTITAMLCGLVVFDLPPIRAVLGWIFPILYQSFPGRIFAIAAFSGSVAAGLGAQWLLVEAGRRGRLRWAASVLAFAGSAWLAAAWVALVHRPEAIAGQRGAQWIVWLEQLRVESLVWAGLWAAAAVVAAWCLRFRPARRRGLLWVPAVVAALDLVHASWGVTPFFSPEEVLPSTPTIDRLSELVRRSEHQYRVLPLPSQFTIPGQVPTFFGLPAVSSYSSWPLARFDSYASATGMRYLRWPYTYFNDCCSPLMNALSPRFVVAPRTSSASSADERPGLGLIQDGPVRIWGNPEALPRVRLVGRVRSVDADRESVLSALVAPDFDPSREAVLEAAGAPLDGFGGDDRVGTARIVRDLPTTVEVEVDAERAGLLVLADTWYPGWRATVNGRQVSVLPVNLALRGVIVPAGRSTVVFRFRPWWTGPGIAMSLLAVLCVAVVLRLR